MPRRKKAEEEKRNTRIQFLATEDESNVLEKACSIEGITKSQFIRQSTMRHARAVLVQAAAVNLNGLMDSYRDGSGRLENLIMSLKEADKKGDVKA